MNGFCSRVSARTPRSAVAGRPTAASPTTQTWIELANGRLVVVKRRRAAQGPPTPLDDRTARRRAEAEASWLLAARHPNVVRLRRVAPDDGLLSTDHAGMLTLRTVHLRPGGAARLLATVAEALAELHRRGLVHGNVRADHVIVTGTDLARPLLCSPAASEGSDECADVIALADLADELTGAVRWAPGWQTAVARLRADGGAIGAAGARRELAAVAARANTRWARVVDPVASEIADRGAGLKEWVERG